jgi:integrase
MLFRLVRPMKRKGSRNVYFQQRIPADVKQRLAVIGGQRLLVFQVAGETVSVAVAERSHAIKFSLRTTDPAEAKVRQAEAAREAELHWKALRQTKAVTLSHRQCVALSGKAYQAWASGERETTAAIERVPVLTGLKPGEAARESRWQPTSAVAMEGESEVWARAARSVDPEKLGALADRLLLAEGINGLDSLDADSREMLLNEIAKALKQAFEARQRNAEGDYRPDPMAERFPALTSEGSPPSSSPSKRASLTSILDGWGREARAAGRTVSTFQSYERSLRQFAVFLKHDDASRITPDDVRRFKDHRIAEGRSLKTVKDSDIAALKSVLGWAVNNGLLKDNPAAGLKVIAPKKARMREPGFTDEEARKVLRHARDLKPSAGMGAKMAAAKRWVPWLCAYSGARVGEIVQLRQQDVRREGGLAFIVITPEAGTVKDKKAREVPLHSDIVEQGFIAFVERASDGYLFLKADPGDDIRGVWQAAKNRLAEFAREVVTDIGVMPSHGWRHSFKTIGREAGIEDSVLDAICGHAPKSVGGAYGSVTLAAKVRAMAKFPRFEL